MILLALAFFIYGIFSPSGAARLWYNVRTFPNRVASWISSGKEFLDYDSYKLNLPSIWEKIDLGSEDDENLDSNIKDVVDIDVKDDKTQWTEEKTDTVSEVEDLKEVEAFPKSVTFVEIPKLKETKKSDDMWVLTWYSPKDLLWVINRYIDENLDDDTDILVTVEYEDDSESPRKIILQTQPKSLGNSHSSASSDSLLDNIFGNSKWEKSEKITISSDEDTVSKKLDNQVEKGNSVENKTTSTKLTQKERKEAEEISSLLF